MNIPIQNDKVNNMGIVPINTDKRALRAQLLIERQAISPSDKEKYDGILCEKVYALIQSVFNDGNILNGKVQKKIIALYSPIRGEPDLTPLFQQLMDDGYMVALPIVVEKNVPLKFMPYKQSDAMAAGAFGILEPNWDESQQVIPDVIVIPCLGFNKNNYRLGYGGGFYDRTLAMFQSSEHHPLTIGVAYTQSQCEFVVDEFDIPLNEIYKS